MQEKGRLPKGTPSLRRRLFPSHDGSLLLAEVAFFPADGDDAFSDVQTRRLLTKSGGVTSSENRVVEAGGAVLSKQATTEMGERERPSETRERRRIRAGLRDKEGRG